MKVVKVQEGETVEWNGEFYEIGDKVYGTENTVFGVGTIEKIQLFGVHFGFRALVSSTIAEQPRWIDSRNITKHKPNWATDV